MSVTLVVLQIVALLAVMWPWQANGFSPIGFAPIAVALAIALWTLAHNRPGNFNVLPEPLARTQLVVTGPYAYVRHPLYAAVVVFAFGCAIGWNTRVHWLAAAALVLILVVKARREERLLAERFADYAAYAARTPGFVPRMTRRPRHGA